VGSTLINDSASKVQLVDAKAKIEGIDVLFIFGIEEIPPSLTSWLNKEEQRYLVFIENEEQKFLKAKESSRFKQPKMRLFYWKAGEEEIFQQIAWEFVFLKFGYGVLSSEQTERAQDFFKQLAHYHQGVDLIASDCEDMGVKVLTNVFHNLQALPSSRLGQALEGKCAGIPAIVCGAGPSLDLTAPLLKTLKDKTILIAGGSAVSALNAHGIVPHLCAHLDPDPPRLRFLAQQHFESPFFYQGRFSHQLLSTVHGPKFWMADSGNYPLESWLAAECGIFTERFDAGWTVANFCTAIAAHLGCNPIIFVGMDCSCGPQTIYASNIAGEENREELIELEKGQLYSKRDWLMSAEWTGAFAAQHSHLKWINTTPRGIDLPGIERKELSEVIDTWLPHQYDIQGLIQEFFFHAPIANVTSEKVAEVRRRIKESFETCQKLCDSLLKVWEKYYPNSPLEKGDYVMLDIELEQEICHRHFLQPLWNVWQRPILRTSFHPLGQHLHRVLFYKKAIEMHLSYLRAFL
jgi:hypothetical protein